MTRTTYPTASAVPIYDHVSQSIPVAAATSAPSQTDSMNKQSGSPNQEPPNVFADATIVLEDDSLPVATAETTIEASPWKKDSPSSIPINTQPSTTDPPQPPARPTNHSQAYLRYMAEDPAHRKLRRRRRRRRRMVLAGLGGVVVGGVILGPIGSVVGAIIGATSARGASKSAEEAKDLRMERIARNSRQAIAVRAQRVN